LVIPVSRGDTGRLDTLAGGAASEERFRSLFETLPQGVVHYDVDGSIIGVNPAASEILGMDLAEVTSWPVLPEGQSVREDGSPFPPDDLPVLVALRTGKVVTGVVAGVRHGRTGELRWVRVTAVPDARDARGRPSRAYAIFTDLTEQRQTEAALRQSNALLGRLRDANVLGVVVVGEDRVYEANDAYLAIIGYSRDDLEAGRVDWRRMTPPGWADTEASAREQLLRTGACQPFEKEYVHKAGHRVPVLIGAALLTRHPLRWTSFVVDLSSRQRAEQERAELVASTRAARAEAEGARERLAFLMRAGAMVAATRDRDELLEQVVQLVVPVLADYCVVFLPSGDGKLTASALSHAEPAQAKLLAGLRGQKISIAGPLLAQRAYSTGATRLSPDASAEMPAWYKAEPGAVGIAAPLRPRSAVATPLLSGHGPLGVVVLCRGAGRAPFTASDVSMIEELGRRLGVGLANADTFTREHDISETLQRSLLPDALPTIPGLDLAVRYLPATEGASVGGDWYDAFPLAHGRVGLVTGDVAGHNIASASTMGQVRSLLRAYAIDNPAPAYALQRTNVAMAELLPDALASVVYVVLDPATGDLTYANAGHPPPIITSGPGRAEYLDDTTGIMLGATSTATFSTGHRQLQPGARMVCYTDGLIEDRRHDLSEGLAALAESLRCSGPCSAEETCATVQAALVGSARADDICLLTVCRVRPLGLSQVGEQSVEGEFLFDAHIVALHGGRQPRVPGGRDRLACQPRQPHGELRHRHRCRHGLVSVPVVPPRLPARLPPVHLLANRASDPDTAPVEIAVVTEFRATRRQQVEQPPSGGGRLATDADQRRAAAPEFVRGGRDHHGILTDPYESPGHRRIMAAQLPQGEHRWLPGFPLECQHLAEGGTRVAGQAEAEHERGEVVKVNSYAGPCCTAGVRAHLGRERQAGQRADCGQGERAARAPVIEGVRIAAALGGEPPDRDPPRRQPPQHRGNRGQQHQRRTGGRGEAAHDASRVEPSAPFGQLGPARHGVVQRRERGRPGGRRIQPVAVAVPEWPGQDRHRLGQAARSGATFAQHPVYLG
jgi:PAS domain S-box-containing protein